MSTSNSQLALSPLDGRYFKKTQPLATIFCEANLNQSRLVVELEYFKALSKAGVIRKLKTNELKFLDKLTELDLKNTQRIKEIEQKTHHDVKAVEYFIREKISNTSLSEFSSFIHFCLTSEDINNLAYRLMIKQGLEEVIKPSLVKLLITLADLSQEYADMPMLARTHGQAAIPTTLGKELAVFAQRLLNLFQQIELFKLQGKLAGAVGSFQAMQLAFPEIEWAKFSSQFIKSLGFEPLTITTQINPQDDVVQLSQIFHHINSILIGLNQDIWRYISDGWLIQKDKEKYVGSSTMPQKINPIEFENSEGNLKIANGIFDIFIKELPISRLQRDLSDSTVRRNIGVAFGHCLIAYQSLTKGLKHIAPNKDKIDQDLNANWNILSEAAQTIARKKGDEQAYEKLAKLSKNKQLNQSHWQELVEGIDPKLKKLTPETYLGLAVKQANSVTQNIYKLLKDN